MKEAFVIPQSTRKIGVNDGTHRIFIEDCVYNYLHDIRIASDEEGRVGVLLGCIQKEDDIINIAVRAALLIENAAVYTDGIAFTSETWSVVKGQIAMNFAGMEVVGWFLTSSVIRNDNLDIMVQNHVNNFEDPDQIFYYMNPKDPVAERFYEYRNEWLKPLNGYDIYYERNSFMKNYLGISDGKVRPVKTEKKDKKGASGDRAAAKRHLTIVYVLSVLLLTTVLVIGVSVINKYDSENPTTSGGESSATDPTNVIADNSTTDGSKETTMDSGETTGNDETDEDSTTEEPTTEEPATEEPTTEEPTTEEPATEVEYRTYTIKSGDTLYGICQTFFGTQDHAKVQEIMALNGLTDSSLLPGTTIKIPN